MKPEARHDSIIIVDFGSQYTQLIARRIREIGVYCEVVPPSYRLNGNEHIRGVILSGSPYSVHDNQAPSLTLENAVHLPILGICYGAQFLANYYGGSVTRSQQREYGRTSLTGVQNASPFASSLAEGQVVWMSHGDTITALPAGWSVLASTESVPVAVFSSEAQGIYGVQYHPEVMHTENGIALLRSFTLDICNCSPDWTPGVFIEESVSSLREQLGDDEVVLGLSGGVDSTVAAVLLHRAIGDRLHCVSVDHGLLRLGEFDEVLAAYRQMGLQIQAVNAEDAFLEALEGVTDPEQKRKIIGRLFVSTFDEAASKLPDVKWLAQGTIYPDVIESSGTGESNATIKSHHNVGGLPPDMKLKVVEPLRYLFKDEVRRVGAALGIAPRLLNRHPFPGPGLSIRILGEITKERVQVLQQADAIYIDALREFGEYDEIWQAGAILLPVRSVGIMGDERTYESVVALRAVTSTDGMTADWYHMPYELLGVISNRIINRVRGVNRVVYDISSKPPATIEWE